MVQTRIIAAEEAGQRLDRWFQRHFPMIPHGRLARLLRTGQIRVDGKRAKGGQRVIAGQSIRIPPLGEPAEMPPAAAAPRPGISGEEAEALRARVLFRDDWIIAIDKPAGLAVQGGSGTKHHLDAMLDALRFEAEERPRLVHRLDRDTAGVLLLARNLEAARHLGRSFSRDEPRKIYWALAAGVPVKRRGVINAPLGKQRSGRGEKMSTAAGDARPATTRWMTVAQKGKVISWLALRPLTGRTHQLRVHSLEMGCPLLGDGKYGGRRSFPDGFQLPRQLFLLAREIAVPHPKDGTTLRVQAPLPEHFRKAFTELGFSDEDLTAEEAAQWLSEKQ